MAADLRPDVDLLRPADAAALLKVSQQTLANWRWRGEGPAFVRLGRLVRYRASDLATWIETAA